jgi:hypothetical protein
MEEFQTSGMTPEGRAAWPAIFEAKLNDLNGKMEYSLQLLIPEEVDLSDMKRHAKAALEKKWGNKPPKGLRSPFRNGTDEKEDFEDYEGVIFINMKSNDKPGVVDQDVNPILDPSELLPGDIVRCTYNAYAYDMKGNKGVAFGLRNVQKIRKGEPMKGGRTRAEDDFGPVSGGGSTTGAADNADMGDFDDDIPF